MRWYEFPARALARLHFGSPHGERPRFFIRAAQPMPVTWLGRGWEPVPGLVNSWTADMSVGSREGGMPHRWLIEMGGRAVDLTGDTISRRFLLRSCPRAARVVGINALGEEVREHDGRRWILWPEMPAGMSWAGDENVYPAARHLRFTARKHFAELARSMVASGLRGNMRIDDGELDRLAASLTDMGRRNGAPWTKDETVARALLLDELAVEGLRPASGSGRPLMAEAGRLEEAFPSLRQHANGTPPPVIAAALSAVAGPLGEASLIAPESGGEAGWQDLFGGGNDDATAVFDGRGLGPAAAAAELGDLVRNRDGRVVALLSQDPGGREIEAARREIGRRRGMEGAIWLPADVTSADPAGLIAIGRPRDEELREAPPQAMRIIQAERREDISVWLDEALRGRQRLAGAEDNPNRNTAYVPMSRLGRASCKIPRGQQEPNLRARRALTGRRGPVDTYVAGLTGLTHEEMAARWAPEQIDGIALAEDAHARGRGFLLADQTGTGKGRTLMGSALAWLRGGENRRVIYLTEKPHLAVEGVMRDLAATGAGELAGRPLLIGGGMPGAVPGADVCRTGTQRRRLFESGGFPQGCRLAVSTYSQFSQADPADETAPEGKRLPARWIEAVAGDPAMMLILDECHKALNPDSNCGDIMRRSINGAGRVLFASATPLRNADGIDLYRRLLPAGLPEIRFRHIAGALHTGDPTTLESYVGMLIEDGVMTRRDHDSGLAPYGISPPDDAERARIEEAMAALRRIGAEMVSVDRDVRRWARRRARDYDARGLLPEGMEAMDRFMVSGFGSPMQNVAGSVLAALKVPQVVRLALAELAPSRDRKPAISLQFTGGSFLEALADGSAGTVGGRPPELRDRLHHTVRTLFRIRDPIADADVDVRQVDPAVAAAARSLQDAIETLPASMPVSPIDAITDELTRAGHSVGEITSRGRRLTADGRIEQRNRPDGAEVVADFNEGRTDVLIFNEAGSTGISLQASPAFGDQRPRTLFQMELPFDILAHIQSLGRINRFDQVEVPNFFTVSTDTIPDQRLQAINNHKLRQFGALIDSDRDHPAVAQGIPDLINPVGVAAVRTVLDAEPDLAACMGHPRAETRTRRNRTRQGNDSKLVQQVFARALLLEPVEQTRLFDLIEAEFGARIAAADAAGTNPLKVPQMPGYIEIRDATEFEVNARTRLATQRQAAGRAETDTAFDRAPMLLTGVWHAPPGLPANAVTAAALEARARMDAEARQSPEWHARELEARATLLIGENASAERQREVTRLISTLKEAEPGSVWGNVHGFQVVTDYLPPGSDFQAPHPHAHRFQVTGPGDPGMEWVPASELMSGWSRASGNILDAEPHQALAQLDAFSRGSRLQPVQILSGDMLTVAAVVQSDGTRSRGNGGQRRQFYVCNFVDSTGKTHRAAVNTAQRHQLDLQKLPFSISARSMLDLGRAWSGGNEVTPPLARQETPESRRRQEQRRHEYDVQLLPGRGGRFEIILPRRGSAACERFWLRDTGREIYRAMTGTDMPGPADDDGSRRAVRRSFDLHKPADFGLAERICALLDRHPLTDLLAAGTAREWWLNNGRHAMAARSPQWQPGSAGTMRDTVCGGLAAGRAEAALRLSWPGGNAEIDCLPGDRPGAVVSLPDYTRSTSAFWNAGGGPELWQRLTSGKLPEKPLPGGGGERAMFVPEGELGSMLSKLAGMTRDAGGSIEVNSRLSTDPEPSIEEEMLAA